MLLVRSPCGAGVVWVWYCYDVVAGQLAVLLVSCVPLVWCMCDVVGAGCGAGIACGVVGVGGGGAAAVAIVSFGVVHAAVLLELVLLVVAFVFLLVMWWCSWCVAAAVVWCCGGAAVRLRCWLVAVVLSRCSCGCWPGDLVPLWYRCGADGGVALALV